MIPTLSECLFFDTETTGLNPWAPTTRCRGLGFLDGADGTHTYLDLDDGCTDRLEPFLALLGERFIVAHNLHYDLAVLRRLGVELPPTERWHCTLTLARLAGPRLPEFGLKPLCVRLFNEGDDDEDQELRQWAKTNKVPVAQRYAKAPQELLSRYCLKDVALVGKLWGRLRNHLQKPKVAEAYAREILVLKELLKAEERGQLINLKQLKMVEEELSRLAAQHQETIFATCGYRFNTNSTGELAEALYGAGLPTRFTKTGKRSTAKGALHAAAKTSPIAEMVLKLREVLKFRTYCTGFRKFMRGPVLACTFDALGAKTGRFSSSNPNLQNIPRPDEKGAALIRFLFVPRPGAVLVTADYSQIELRIIAMYAQDTRMLELLRAGGDIHKATAEALFGTATKDLRQVAKSANFLLGYGGTADKLQSYLGNRKQITLKEAREFVRAYHSKFPGIARLAGQCMGEVARTGGITDVLGRFYPVPSTLAYASVNYLVQGTCASILKHAIIRLGPLMEAIKATMVSFIHDEIVIDTIALPDDTMLEIQRLMEVQVPGITVATPVEMAVCALNWAKKEPFVYRTAPEVETIHA